jgi:hypothetical protein
MGKLMPKKHRETIFKLIISHERSMAALGAIGFMESANILRISWLDLSRRLHDISSAELETLADRFEAMSPANDTAGGVNGHAITVSRVDSRPDAAPATLRRKRSGH